VSILALTLVLVAAVVHPTWNLLARRATQGDPIAFVWLTSALSAGLYVPIVVTLSVTTPTRLHDVRADLAMMAGTGILHVIYFVLLQRSYRVSEFSLVYPLARGTGPLVTALVAVTLLGERLDPLQFAGIAIIVVAIFVIAGGRANGSSALAATRSPRRSLGYGITTGFAIAAYTLWDKQAVSVLAISPILYDFGRTVSQTLLLSPTVLHAKEKRNALRTTWSQFRGEAFGVAILSPLAYVLILYALTAAPVSLVAPLRESSIVIGAFMGAHVLKEGELRRRIVAHARRYRSARTRLAASRARAPIVRETALRRHAPHG
jgi:drug/metabolite transporter (DMT)-like permease